MIYTLTLNPSLDYIMYPGEIAIGKTNRSEKEVISVGGKGINVSVVLKSLGCDSRALGFAAGFTGEEILRQLSCFGVSNDFIRLSEGVSRINVKLFGENETEVNGNGPCISESDMDKLYSRLDALSRGDILVLAGSIPSTLPKDTYERILDRLCGKGVHFVVDASGELLLKALRFKPFLIKPNTFELGEIFGKEPSTDDEIISCAERLQHQGAANVLVSMAGNGALLLTVEGKIHRVKAAKGTVVNSVGAGDSMVAGFIAGYFEKHDYEYALKLGSAAGAATAFSVGLGERDRIYELLAAF